MSEILVNTIKKADGTGSITVPAETGTVLTSATALSSFPSGFANGITMADQWRITTNVSTNSSGVKLTNWERNDDDGYGGIGTGMTEASGIFTFPQTGIYLIIFAGEFDLNGDTRYANMALRTATDGSTYGFAARCNAFIQQTSSNRTFNGASQNFIFDVTNTSTHKCFFEGASENSSASMTGTTERQITAATFIRIGDT